MKPSLQNEAVRLCFMLFSVVFALGPFLSNRLMGGRDALCYAHPLADYRIQVSPEHHFGSAGI